jgi:transcriptional regulator with XRE-family HTH domain
VASRRDPDRSALALFAEELRAARTQAGMSRDDLAVKLSYSASLIGMLEGLHRVPQADFAQRCDEAFGTPGTFARMQQRLRNLPFPASFRPFAAYEEIASTLRAFEHAIVPGLLQTAEYARAVLATRPNTTDDEIDDLVTVRLARQAILERDDPPLLWAVIDEAVLHRPVGTSQVMHDQLMHLVGMSGRPNITVQVVPYSAGAHSGLLGAFVIAEFNDDPGIVYLDTAIDGQTVEEPAMVAKAALTFDTLRSEALPRGASRDLIMRVAEERWT